MLTAVVLLLVGDQGVGMVYRKHDDGAETLLLIDPTGNSSTQFSIGQLQYVHTAQTSTC